MVYEQTDFHNVWHLIQRNLFSIATALGLHDSTGIPSAFTQITLPYQLVYFHFLANTISQWSYLSKAKTLRFRNGQNEWYYKPLELHILSWKLKAVKQKLWQKWAQVLCYMSFPGSAAIVEVMGYLCNGKTLNF